MAGISLGSSLRDGNGAGCHEQTDPFAWLLPSAEP